MLQVNKTEHASELDIFTELQKSTNKRRIHMYKSFMRVLLLGINFCWSSFFFGYGIVYLGLFKFSNIAEIYSIEMNVSLAQGLLQGCIPVGAAFAALITSILLKVLSRRTFLLTVNAVAFLVTALLLVPNFGLFLFCRFCQGLCVGFYSALVPLLLKQFSPVEISGTIGALNSVFLIFGIYFISELKLILQEFSPEKEHWRYVFGFPLLTIFVQTILLLTYYRFNTPRYLLEHSRQEEFFQVLHFIYKKRYVNLVEQHKRQQVYRHEQQMKSQLSNPQKFKPNPKRVSLAIHIAVMQQFSGVNSLVGYTYSIVFDIFPDFASAIPVFLNFQQFVGALLTSYLLDRLGRKTILQIGVGCASFCLLLIAIGFFIRENAESAGNGLIFTGLIIYMFNLGFSIGPIVWVYIAEIVEPKIIPFSTFSNWLAAAIVMIPFPIIADSIGTPAPLFLFFFIWSFVSFFINWKFVIETKHKTQAQIFSEYERKTQ